MKNFNLTKIDNITRILLIALIIAVAYFVVFLILRPLLITQPVSMTEMMNKIVRGDTNSSLINIISLIIALIIGIIVSFHLFKTDKKDSEFNIIKKALSEDERKVLDEIKKAGEITQDSLRIRLDWSKAKISTILINLDKSGLIQRERVGKTYKVYLERE